MSDSVIFTSIFGGYDDLKDPIVHDEFMHYICFTDDPDLTSEIWETQVVEPKVPGNSSKSSKFIKICAHEFLSDFTYSLYIDGTMTVKNKFRIPYILNGKKIAIEIHPCRDCIYEEAIECIQLGKVEPDIINAQLDTYRQEGFLRHAGLYANWMIARKHNDAELIELSEEWWAHVLAYSKRDQISFPVVFKNYSIEPIPMGLRQSIVNMSRHLDNA